MKLQSGSVKIIITVVALCIIVFLLLIAFFNTSGILSKINPPKEKNFKKLILPFKAG